MNIYYVLSLLLLTFSFCQKKIENKIPFYQKAYYAVRYYGGAESFMIDSSKSQIRISYIDDIVTYQQYFEKYGEYPEFPNGPYEIASYNTYSRVFELTQDSFKIISNQKITEAFDFPPVDESANFIEDSSMISLLPGSFNVILTSQVDLNKDKIKELFIYYGNEEDASYGKIQSGEAGPYLSIYTIANKTWKLQQTINCSELVTGGISSVSTVKIANAPYPLIYLHSSDHHLHDRTVMHSLITADIANEQRDTLKIFQLKGSDE